MEQRLKARATCPSGATLYAAPAAGAQVDLSSGSVVFKWNPGCYPGSVKTVDLTITSPTAGVIQNIQGVNFADGTYTVKLLPRMWGSKSEIDLQYTLSESDAIFSFLGTLPQGPSFHGTYPTALLVTTSAGATVTAAAADTSNPDPITVQAIGHAKSGLPAGSIFAAVFFPIVIVVVAALLYIRFMRSKQAQKRQRWSSAIDQRMSRISGDWTPGIVGANGSSRRSMASSNHRSTMHEGENRAGFAANRPSLFISDADAPPQPEMSQTSTSSFARPRVASSLNADGERKSVARVSFAHVATPNSRVSFDNTAGPRSPRGNPSSVYGNSGHAQSVSTFGRPSLSIHGPSGLGKRDSDEYVVSPDQVQGPFAISHTSLGYHRDSEEQEEEELEDFSDMAAVQMMNVSTIDGVPVKHMAGPKSPALSPPIQVPVPAAQSSTPKSPLRPALKPSVSSFFDAPAPTTAPDASPDDMLAAYARARKASAAGTPATTTAPAAPTAGVSSQSLSPASSLDVQRRMTLTPGSPVAVPVTVGVNNPYRASMLSESSRYSGVDQSGHAK